MSTFCVPVDDGLAEPLDDSGFPEADLVGAGELDESVGPCAPSSPCSPVLEAVGDAELDVGAAELLVGSAELLVGCPDWPPWAASADAVGKAMKATRAVAVVSPPSAMADSGLRRSHQRLSGPPRGSC